MSLARYPFLAELGLGEENIGCYDGTWEANGEFLTSVNPADGTPIAKVKQATPADYDRCLTKMAAAKAEWASLPTPYRGEIIRQVGDALRKLKEPLGLLVSLEMGKIRAEGAGEVQEYIDVCDFATGLSRTLNGQIIPSERPGHVLMERWNPLGMVGIISAFNFPCAVFGWNHAISAVVGNVQIWKGASSTSLVTVALTKIVASVLEANKINGAVACMVVGPGRTIGELLLNDKRLSLISFTGSTEVGRRVATTVAGRFGRTILELGGNNALIVMDDADLKQAARAALFGSVGTAGQRCTSTRRILVHEKVYDEFVSKFTAAYKSIPIGDPLDAKTLMGPIHTKSAVADFIAGVELVQKHGGKILHGGKVIDRPGNFVEPTIVEIDSKAACLQDELFLPIVYIIKITSFEHAVEVNNGVPQGLSSALFTSNQAAVFKWTGPLGSDCGIVNVNAGTSGAEIGGAFGGEKETGGGRESGSDAWKQYARRATCVVNFSDEMPLAQGIKFGDD